MQVLHLRGPDPYDGIPPLFFRNTFCNPTAMIFLTRRDSTASLLNALRPIALIVILYWLFASESANAAPAIEPVDHIRDAAVAHVRASVSEQAKVDAGRLDSRLRLAACPTPLDARTASDRGSALSVEVRCDALGWKLFVPVSVSEQVPVLVAARPLLRGESLGTADVTVQMRDRAGLGTSWIGSSEQLQGRVLSRPVATGAVLLPSAFTATRVVRRGQSVTLVGSSGGFQVRAQGKALADAAAGESLRVENPSSRRVVEGQVMADGTVSVPL